MTILRPRLPGYVLCFALLAALASGSASAATCGGLPNPILVTATGVAFGLYSPGANAPARSNGTVTVTCTITIGATLPSFTIALSAGTYGTFTQRKMGFGTARLNYNLYTTDALGTIWGDGTTPSATQSYTASALALTSFTVYGSLAIHQFASLGVFADGITVTVTY
ncbi:MAG TPA: spore coat protein U domain-containing protein [Rhizomicrobium sp.]